ncbi:MAG: ATP-dependent DNA helicase [Beijerinckiaceae bacterium]|nr:MAG: ATP-dependent DNA helicase [Beijerinckiaceae bacterium]
MRPTDLDPYFAPVARLPGIGPKLSPLFDTLTGRAPEPARIVDLLFHLPIDLVDRSLAPSIRAAPTEGIVTLKVTVEAHRPAPPGRAKAPHRVTVGDETGDVSLVFFRLPKQQIETMLPIGATRIISGRMELFDGMRQMVHPDRILPPAKFSEEDVLEPVYPLTEGLTSRRVHQAALAALDKTRVLPEWLDATLLERQGWPGFRHALALLHNPREQGAFGAESPAYKRLAYDELLAGQIALQLVRAREKGPAGRSLVGDGRLRAKILTALPYTLTGAQARSLGEIEADMAKPERMLRLLQGDVGAGKTIVALMAMAIAVEAGAQGAMMAPTEILARQHFERIRPLAEAAGITTGILTGRAGSAERNATLKRLASGEIDIVLGTHALFQDDVTFANLGVAIVDEQHRFGVHQRLALAKKGEAVDLLVMTATPIPRTLVLGYFGDLDVSQLDEKPPGRKPVDTRLVNHERLDEMIAGIGRAIGTGARVYWVCPLVGESEKLELAAAEERYADLAARFPGKVGLVHGKMPGAEKDDVIARFAAGTLSVLVATTVIEVGMDVPEATIMVIEEAQRFGLAQLHQLRGRVGRGGEKSTAILLYRGPLSETARARLEILRQTEDGFRIAEEDLRLRGEGDLLGTRQSGLPGFRIARLDLHQDLLRMARDDAVLMFARDPALASERGKALRCLLYLFEREEAIRLMTAG